jgi:hypothetical protein
MSDEPIREDENTTDETADVEAHSADDVLDLQNMPDGSDEAGADGSCISIVSIAVN